MKKLFLACIKMEKKGLGNIWKDVREKLHRVWLERRKGNQKKLGEGLNRKEM